MLCLLWGSQTWSISPKVLQALDSVFIRSVRYMLRIRRKPHEKWLDWHRRSFRWCRLIASKYADIWPSAYFLEMQWRWSGHLARSIHLAGRVAINVGFQMQMLNRASRLKVLKIATNHAWDSPFQMFLDLHNDGEFQNMFWHEAAADRERWRLLEPEFAEYWWKQAAVHSQKAMDMLAQIKFLLGDDFVIDKNEQSFKELGKRPILTVRLTGGMLQVNIEVLAHGVDKLLRTSPQKFDTMIKDLEHFKTWADNKAHSTMNSKLSIFDKAYVVDKPKNSAMLPFRTPARPLKRRSTQYSTMNPEKQGKYIAAKWKRYHDSKILRPFKRLRKLTPLECLTSGIMAIDLVDNAAQPMAMQDPHYDPLRAAWSDRAS